MSVSVLTVAVKGHQEGIVQQQIKAMGLRQWLSLVVAWIVNWIYAEASSICEFIAASAPTFCPEPVARKESCTRDGLKNIRQQSASAGPSIADATARARAPMLSAKSGCEQVQQTARFGVPVRGHFHWSLAAISIGAWRPFPLEPDGQFRASAPVSGSSTSIMPPSSARRS